MKLIKPGLLRNISTIAASTLVSQAALLAAMPALTRLFPPEAFGLFATFSALHAVALIIFSLKYDMAIIIPKNDGEARQILALAIYIPAVLSSFLLFVLLLSAAFMPAVRGYLLLLPAAILSASVYGAFQQWGARQKDYRHYAISQIVNTGMNLALCLIIGFAVAGFSEGLILGFVGGLLSGALYMTWASRRVFDRARFKNTLPLITSLGASFRQYAHMPLQVLPFTILVVIAQSAAPLVLSAHYPLAEIGLFAVASRVLLAPSSILGSAIGEPFRAELAARIRNNQDLAAITRKSLATLLAVSALAFSLIYVIAPWMFEFLFGKAFAASSGIARALCIGAFCQFIILPVTFTFVVTGHMRTGLFAQAIIALVPNGVLFMASMTLPMTKALGLWSLSMLICGLLFLALVYRAALLPRHSQNSLVAGS